MAMNAASAVNLRNSKLRYLGLIKGETERVQIKAERKSEHYSHSQSLRESRKSCEAEHSLQSKGKENG